MQTFEARCGRAAVREGVDSRAGVCQFTLDSVRTHLPTALPGRVSRLREVSG